MKALVVALAVTYPFLAHYAVAHDDATLVVASVGVLVLAIVLPGLARGSPGALAFAAGAAVSLYALATFGLAHLVLFLPPVLITGGLAYFFGRTLARGRMPLIEQLVRAIHPPESPELERRIAPYARRLTAAWTILLATIAAANLALALFADRETWSFFANFANYGLIAAFFVIEYAYRRRIFPDQPYRNFADFARRVAATAPGVFRGR